MKISVPDFSAPIGASVFKFSVHLQVGKVYCVNENKDAKAHFAFFFHCSFCHSYIIHKDIFRKSFLSQGLFSQFWENDPYHWNWEF